ncbi:hypothetical protein D3C77_457230 [compost metagenome]
MDQRFERGAVHLQHLVEAVDGRVGWHAVVDAAAQRHGLQQRNGVSVEAELVTDYLGGTARQRVLAEQRGGDEGFGQAGAVGDLGERQVFTGLGQENDVGQGEASVLADLRLDHGVISVGKKGLQAACLGLWETACAPGLSARDTNLPLLPSKASMRPLSMS